MTEKEIIKSIEETIKKARVEQKSIVFQLNALMQARDILRGES